MFIYFNDFINSSEETLDFDTFLLANQNLFFPFKKKKSNSEKQEKKERKLLQKIFLLLSKKENTETYKTNSLTLIELLKYCVALGNNNTGILYLYSYLDKTRKGSVEKEEFKIYLNNLLEFFFAEEKKLKEKISEKNLEDESNSQSESQMQENIDKIISDFTRKINFKKFKNLISQSEFINVFENNEALIDEFGSLVKKTEIVIFSRVFNFNFNSQKEDEEEIFNDDQSSESKFFFLQT